MTWAGRHDLDASTGRPVDRSSGRPVVMTWAREFSSMTFAREFSSMTFPRLNNFITQNIDEDLSSGRHKTITTRFPPEPNGYLHLGHAKSICLNFGLAKQYGGDCHLRFDDTNPETEEDVYIESIKRDVKWLGGDWGEKLYHASDYFDQLYEWAVILIKKGLAYVDDQTEEEVRLNRGSLFEPGKNSFYRDRSVEENLILFEKMKNGELHEGSCILRAKIDMTHSNMNMRDPPMYRIKKKTHPRAGDKWVIYPIYDWAHGQSDSIERISHSICTLEFSLHKLLYDWFQEKLNIYPTRQIEFARLNLTFTVLSKRRLIKLVNSNYVNGWDDPRMPTISGCRRRGYPASAIRKFVHEIGVAKRDIIIPFSKLESFVRDELEHVQRRIVVIDPIKLTISGLPTEGIRCFALNHPKDTEAGSRPIQLTQEIFIQKADFMIKPIAKFNRLSPGKSVNLKYANIAVKCDQLVEENGNLELLCSVCEPSSKNSTIHWLGTNDYVE